MRLFIYSFILIYNNPFTHWKHVIRRYQLLWGMTIYWPYFVVVPNNGRPSYEQACPSLGLYEAHTPVSSYSLLHQHAHQANFNMCISVWIDSHTDNENLPYTYVIIHPLTVEMVVDRLMQIVTSLKMYSGKQTQLRLTARISKCPQ